MIVEAKNIMYTLSKSPDENIQLPYGSFVNLSKAELISQGVSEGLYESLKEFVMDELFINGYPLLNYYVEDFGTAVRIKYKNAVEQVLEVKIVNTKKIPECDGLFTTWLEI